MRSGRPRLAARIALDVAWASVSGWILEFIAVQQQQVFQALLLHPPQGRVEILEVPVLARPMDERLASAVLPHMDRHRHRIGVLVGMDTVGNRKTGDLRAPG
jgi:hypothetical protein